MSSVSRSLPDTSPVQPVLQRMTVADLPEVTLIEESQYSFPWTRGNFLDSIESGYDTWILRDKDSHRLLGYFLLMHAVDESHLLNITVHAREEGRGYCRTMLDKVVTLSRDCGMNSVLLEVRPSNTRALNIYLRYGFTRIGTRRNYYPAPDNRREDAIVMRLAL